jgi:hypothetical protein
LASIEINDEIPVKVIYGFHGLHGLHGLVVNF